MIRLENISYQVGDKKLLDDISVTFDPAKLNLIIGPNGAGKSTLIKIICHQLHPQAGNIFLCEKNIKNFTVQELARIRAVLSQNVSLAFPLSVYEVVMMGRYPHFTGKPGKRDKIACDEAMDFFDVADMAGRNYLTLSGGEKQRVQFARVLAQIWYPLGGAHRYLVLDEPLTFLDVHYQFDFMNKLVRLLQQTDMVIIGVVHDLNLAAKFADNILLLNQGKLLSSGSKEKVLTKENIKTAYTLEPIIHYENGRMFLFF